LSRAKIERLWGTFQDRLISELRLEGISTLEQANEYLDSVFIPKYKRKFTRKPKVKEIAYRPMPQEMDLDQILCKKERICSFSNGSFGGRDTTFCYFCKKGDIITLH